jgi:eukaryotic-like serine/threonine-protein kinase
MRIEYPIGKVLYETSGWVSHPRVSPDGDRVAFIDHPTPDDDGGSVAVVDRSGKRKTLTQPFATAEGLAWSRDGEIWFTAAQVGFNRALYVTTPSGGIRLRARVPGNLTLQDVSHEGKLLLTRDSIRPEIVALPKGESKERELAWLDGSVVAAISQDGSTVLLTESAEGGGAGYSVYVRKTDGSPAVRLGEGSAQDLSPDGEWALAILHPASDPQLVAYPTGAGQPKIFSKEGVSVYSASFLPPDGKRIVVTGSEPGHGPRLYLRDFEEGKPRPVSPEGYQAPWMPVSAPDGRWTLAWGPDYKRQYLHPIAGGEPTAVPGLDPDDQVVQCSADGRFVYVRRLSEVSAAVYRLEIATGRRELWRTLMPADAAGVSTLNPYPTPDGDAYVYSYLRTLSDLYYVEGLM